jgi:lipopolysaccharide export system protein LptA
VKGKVNRIVATGHVLFDAPSGTASGTRGVYNLVQRRITLTGNVVLTKGKNVMRGTQLVMDLGNGKAKLTARGTSGGRVQGLFTPPPRHKTPSDKREN